MMKNVSKIFTGNSSNHIFLLNSNQKLFGCGWNEYGQLGLGESRKEEKIDKLTKIQNIPKGKIIDIQSGCIHSIMLIENENENPKRKLYSCGSNAYSGIDTNHKIYEFTEIKSSLFENDDNILEISVGHYDNLILTTKGKLIGFGNNAYGELGTGDTYFQFIPIQIELPELRFNENIFNYHLSCGYRKSFLYYSPFLSFSNLEEDLIKLFGRKEFSDISFETKNGEIIEAHKLILKYRLNQNQNQIEKLKEIISKKSIKESNQIFEMIYSNRIINPKLYCEIKEIINLNEKIEETMKRIYLNENEKDFIIERKEKQYKFPKLILIMRSELYRGMFLSVTEDKSNKVTDYSELKNHLNSILSNNDIPTNEFELFQSIIKWGKHKLNINQEKEIDKQEKEQIQDQISNVIHKIRFIDFSNKKIAKILKEDLIPNQIHQAINDLLIMKSQKNERELQEFIESQKQKQKQNSFIFNSRFNFHNSSIIQAKKHFIKLKEWINDDEFIYKMKLGFSAKRDGFSAQKWHEKCDNKGKTLVIIKTKDNFIFGGFTKVGFISGNNRYIKDPNAFIFSLRNDKNNRKPEKFSIKPKEDTWAIYYNFSDNGPKFGEDIKLNSDLQPGFLNFGWNYILPKGIKEGTDEARSYLGGSFDKWVVEELETFFI
ncbi:pep-cterm sorting domain-containing protein [Anaeramoeba ignava]|uniref:Pep-cterm sorting domain-containing protein n=1 Tax=Anaeramoeba ignava TaxID=1746090 RepID=A0A9Q0LR69_ANAIG|nr:pep-cterm sorting domain-containing protein [Anaeramoeba ignava]